MQLMKKSSSKIILYTYIFCRNEKYIKYKKKKGSKKRSLWRKKINFNRNGFKIFSFEKFNY